MAAAAPSPALRRLAQGGGAHLYFRERVEVVSKEPEADAKHILRDFTRRAFRRGGDG